MLFPAYLPNHNKSIHTQPRGEHPLPLGIFVCPCVLPFFIIRARNRWTEPSHIAATLGRLNVTWIRPRSYTLTCAAGQAPALRNFSRSNRGRRPLQTVNDKPSPVTRQAAISCKTKVHKVKYFAFFSPPPYFPPKSIEIPRFICYNKR